MSTDYLFINFTLDIITKKKNIILTNMTFLNYINNIMRRYQKEQLKQNKKKQEGTDLKASSTNSMFKLSTKRQCASGNLKSNENSCRSCGNRVIIIFLRKQKSPVTLPSKGKLHLSEKIHHSTLLNKNETRHELKQRLTLKRTHKLSPSFLPKTHNNNLTLKNIAKRRCSQPLQSTFKKTSHLHRINTDKKRLANSTFRIDYASTPIKNAPKTSTPRKVPTIQSSPPFKRAFPVL